MNATSNGSPTNPNLALHQSQCVGGKTPSTKHLKVPTQKLPPSTVDKPPKALGDSRNHCEHPKRSPLSSTTRLDDWRGNLTFFKGFTSTQPSETFENLDWTAFGQKIYPDEPTVVTDKKDATYFLPCLLRDAPLTGSTLERAEKAGEPTVGKMRSKDHVTESNVLLFDFDGIEASACDQIRSYLEKQGLTYVAYTTFSHGLEDKPGMYVRVCLPVDQLLDAEAYPVAWHAFAGLLAEALESDQGQSGQEGA